MTDKVTGVTDDSNAGATNKEVKEEHHQPNDEQDKTVVNTPMAGVLQNQDGQVLNDEIAGVPNTATDKTNGEDNSEAEGQENNPIKYLREVFKQKNAMLQGEIREIRKATKRQGRRSKPTKKRTTKRVKWSDRFNSNKEIKDEGA
eukprot:9083877-Ditylum_brightwellii.AAC.1